MSTIEALIPALTSFSLLDLSILQPLYNIFPANTNCKGIANHIYAILPLNTLLENNQPSKMMKTLR